MRAVIQRVARAGVDAEDTTIGEITGPGPTMLLEVARDDGCEQVATLAREIAKLRILGGECSVMEVNAPILAVNQFTLYGDTRKGWQPSWSKATPSEQAEPLVNVLVEDLHARGLYVETGVFGAMMEVSLVNSGPFTVLIETRGVKTGPGQRPEVSGDGN